ncbi:hypothetical protein ACIF6L_37830 [Kitasatospora sp. NPDC086009]|uniref:hypothetical protein n=1 Tax=unclassified Kitasatospora TaxID=2633591 RepID=UPI0037C77044
MIIIGIVILAGLVLFGIIAGSMTDGGDRKRKSRYRGGDSGGDSGGSGGGCGGGGCGGGGCGGGCGGS